jgi:hypothetical protein
LATFRLSLFIDPSDINVTGIVLSGIWLRLSPFFKFETSPMDIGDEFFFVKTFTKPLVSTIAYSTSSKWK